MENEIKRQLIENLSDEVLNQIKINFQNWKKDDSPPGRDYFISDTFKLCDTIPHLLDEIDRLKLENKKLLDVCLGTYVSENNEIEDEAVDYD